MKIQLWSYIKGYVIIKIETLSIEKLLNLIVSENIHIWDIQKITHTTLRAKVDVRGFKKLKKIARKLHFNICIEKKQGLPFILHKFKARKMLGAGIIIFIFIIYYLSCFIWDIEIIGNTTIEDSYIIDKLEEYGLRLGAKKENIDLDALENNLLLDLDELSWVGAEIKGSKVIVRIVEAIDKPEVIDDRIPCDIIAKKDALIENIITLNGDALVEKGDIVKKGDILITGIIQLDEQRCSYVHSMGEILGRTWYEYEVEQPLENVEMIYTGNKDQIKILKIFGFEFIIKNKNNNFTKYEKKVTTKKLINSNILDIPLYLKIETYHEIYEKKQKITVEQAKNIAKEEVLKKLIQDVPQEAKIADKHFKFSITQQNKVKVNAIIEVLENIGEKQIIDIN